MNQPFVAQMFVGATDPVPMLEQHERERLKAAAFRARQVFPGPIGEFLNRELTSWSVIGLRFDSHGLLAQVIATVLNAPLPEPPAVVQAA